MTTQTCDWTSTFFRNNCRRNVRLELQQPGMARRRENTTRYVSYQRRMQWRMEWRFPAADDLSISDIRRVCDASRSLSSPSALLSCRYAAFAPQILHRDEVVLGCLSPQRVITCRGWPLPCEFAG